MKKQSKWKSNQIWRITPLLFFPLVSACRYPISAGHYEGYLQRNPESESQPVAFDVTYPSYTTGEIRIHELKNSFETKLEVHLIHPQAIELRIPLIRPEPFRLKKDGKCFVSPSITPSVPNRGESAEICFSKKKVLLRIASAQDEEILVLTGNAFAPETLPPFEKPRTLSLDEAIQLALHSNLESKQELERVYQAKERALFAYMELLPRPNVSAYVFSALWGVSLLPIYTALAAGDFVPFLLPSRHIRGLKAKKEYRAEQMAAEIMKADLISQVETLACLFQGSKEISNLYAEALDTLTRLQESLQSLSEKDQDRIQALIETITLEKIKSESAMHKALFSLSEVLGFSNPLAVQGITLESTDLKSEALTRLEADSESQLTVRRSLELKQIDYLIRAAQFDQLQSYFGWLDLRGEAADQLGFTLIPQIRIKKSKVREIENKRKWLKDQIVKKTYEVVDAYNEAVQSYPSLKKNADHLKNVLSDFIQEAKAHQTLEVSELETKLQGAISAAILLNHIQIEYETARIRLDRLKLHDYSKAAFHRQDLVNSIP